MTFTEPSPLKHSRPRGLQPSRQVRAASEAPVTGPGCVTDTWLGCRNPMILRFTSTPTLNFWFCFVYTILKSRRERQSLWCPPKKDDHVPRAVVWTPASKHSGSEELSCETGLRSIKKQTSNCQKEFSGACTRSERGRFRPQSTIFLRSRVGCLTGVCSFARVY